MTEYDDGLDWTWPSTQTGPVTKAAGMFVDEPRSAVRARQGAAVGDLRSGRARDWGR